MQADGFEVLDIRVARGRDSGYSVVMRLGEREFPAGTIDAGILTAVAEASPDDQGARLFAAFTSDEPVRLAWNLAGALAPRRRIRLRIEDDAPELHALPWEALRDGSPTATAREPAFDRDTPFSRSVAIAWDLLPAVSERPLRVLSAVAAPSDLDVYSLPPIDRAGEEAMLAEAITGADLVEHTALTGPCSLAAIEAALERGYHVLHLVAHGVARRDGEVAIFLERADGTVDRVDGAAFAAMLERLDRTLRLCVLMVCKSAARSPGNIRAGLAPKLLAAGVPAVLAMQDLMPIETGRAFTRAFYGQLWTSGDVDRAANRARATLLTARLGGSAVPVLYSALAGNHLYLAGAPRAAEPVQVAEPRPAPTRPTITADGWEQLDGKARNITAVCGGDGCIELFALDAGGILQSRRQAAPGGAYDEWQYIGDDSRDFATVVDTTGKICLFVVDNAGGAWFSERVDATSWSDWVDLGAKSTQLTAACGAYGIVTIYIVDEEGLMKSTERDEPDAAWNDWSGDWENDEETHQQISAVRDGKGRNAVLSLHDDGELWSSHEDKECEYSEWKKFGAQIASFCVIAGEAGRLLVCALDQAGALRCCEQKTPGGPWGGWQQLGGEHSEVVAVRRKRGGVEIFGLTADGRLHGITQTDGSFGAWTEIAAPRLAQLVAVETGAGALELLALDRLGGLHRRVLTAS